MNTINIKLYDILRQDLKLSEEKAKAFVEAIDEVVQEDIKHSGTEFKSIFKDDLYRLELSTTKEIRDSKIDLIKWMFAFWVGSMATLSGILFALFNIYMKK